MDMNEYVLEILARERLAALRGQRESTRSAPGATLASRWWRRALQRALGGSWHRADGVSLQRPAKGQAAAPSSSA